MDNLQFNRNDSDHHHFKEKQKMICGNHVEELKFRIKWILSNQRIESNIALMFAGILLAIGFFVGDVTNNQNYGMIREFASPFEWAIILIIYSLIKLLSIIWIVPKSLCTLNGIFGIWMWNYIFLSFSVFDTTPISPAELLLILPILIEFWAMIDIPKKEQQNGK